MAHITERGERFSHLLALELKGVIASYGSTVKTVAAEIGVDHTTLYRYFNGSRALPSTVLNDASEVIGVEPADLVERAYKRLLLEFGPYQGGPGGVGLSSVPVAETAELDPSVEDLMLAASTRDIDSEVEAWEEQP